MQWPALVQRAKSEGENPMYYVLGQTDAGRYLFCVVIRLPQTDSIQELANFWDTHEVNDFEDELDEVRERPSTQRRHHGPPGNRCRQGRTGNRAITRRSRLGADPRVGT